MLFYVTHNSLNWNVCTIICHCNLLRAAFPREKKSLFLFLSKRPLDKYDIEMNGVNIVARMSSNRIDTVQEMNNKPQINCCCCTFIIKFRNITDIQGE